MEGRRRPDPGFGGVLLLVVGVAGFAMCLTLLYNGSQAVMAIGGFCAEGGPYVIEQHCPEGAAPATLLGILGLWVFGAIGLVGAARVGGYGWLIVAAWTATFGVLGWGFLQSGVIDPPEGETVVWGFLIPGVVFELMAWVPAALLVVAWWGARRSGLSLDVGVSGIEVTKGMPGPGQPGRAAEIPVDPARRAEATGADDELVTAGGAPEFAEGTQALMDRLERLADMRDRGLLSPDEYETAKDLIIRELETRQ